LGAYEQALASHTNFNAGANTGVPAIDPGKIYTLPELIDVAERSHPETRIAWERARQAAKAVGLNESAYYPYLAASAAADFQHELGLLTSVFPANAFAEDATLDLKWLLFDFGGRKAGVASARERLMMANVGFNATHQQIVFMVTKSFYDFNTARELAGVDASAQQAADTVRESAQARFDHGLATKPEVLQAEQQSAQAAYDLEAARGSLSDAQVALVNSLGILPSTPLLVAAVPEKQFTDDPEDSLDDLIDRALAQRPDLVAKLASLRASQAEVRQARAAYYPKISLAANGGWSKLDVNAYDSPYIGNSKPTYGVGLEIELPLFDGFARANKLRIAESKLRTAESELADTRNTAVREVWKSYTDLKTALRKRESADKLLVAAQSAFDATLEVYRQGLGTYVDVANAQRYLTAARSTVVDARSDIFTGAAALALSVGDLAKPDANASTTIHQP
jgi:outer membrane protein TolC